MTKTKSTKRALLLSALSLLMCVSMLIGSTFAWFTDSVTSAGNKIQSGTLKLDLELLDKEDGWASIKESQAPIFDYDLWEPGYTDVKVLKVENEGTLALKWYAKFVSANDLSILADVIDVFVCPSATELTYPADRNLDGYTKVGTVRDFVNTIESTTHGNLEAGEVAYLGIALKMQEEAGNEYQDLILGAFDVMILATQDTVEEDSFDDQYDANAEFDKVKLPAKKHKVTTPDEFVAALDEAATGDRGLIIDATGVTVDINAIGSDIPNGKKAIDIPGDVTVQNLTVIGSYRGGNTLYFQGTADQEIVFENCTFELSGRSMGFDFMGAEGGVNSVVYNSCSFKGAIVLEFLSSKDGVATYNNCTFTKHPGGGSSYVMANGGTHLFNGCTFDYTGLTQSNMGIINTCSVNATSESDGSNSTVVILDGCTRINCGTRKYGADSTLTIK